MATKAPGKQPKAKPVEKTAAGRFAKGNSGGAGRPKGSPNKTTKSLKALIMEALEAGDGALEYFKGRKLDDPASFDRLLSRILPKEVVADINITTSLESLVTRAREIEETSGSRLN